jgi:hypothetical protein
MARRGGVLSGAPFDRRELVAIFVGYPLGVVVVLAVFTAVLGVGGEVVVVVAAAVPLVPFLLVMGFAGHLEEFRGGPVEVVFRQARRTIQPVGLVEERVEVAGVATEAAAVDYERYLADFEGRGVLSIALGDEPSHEDLEGYLTHMRQLEYVAFTDDGRFAGMMPATAFRSLYALDPDRLYDHVESRRILDSAGVVRDSVDPEATNLEALDAMDRTGADVLPVVGTDDTWPSEVVVGLVSQDAITRGLLLELLRQDRPDPTEAHATGG